MVITLAIAFSVMQTPSFTSSTLILSDVNTASESVLGSFFSAAMFDPDRFIKTQAEIIQTEVVAQGVEARLTENYTQIKERQALGSDEDVYVPEYVPGTSELMSMVMVTQRERTNTFEIDVTASNQYLARDVAQAYAEEYINNRQLAAIRQISEARKEVWNRIQELEDQIEQVSQRIDQYANGNVPSELQAEGSRAINLWTTLYEKYMSLRIAESLQQRGLEIIENAKLGGQVGPRPYRNAILGMLVGLLLGIGLAFLWEYLDDTLKTRDDFEKYYDCPIVGEIAFTPTEEVGEFEIVYFSRPNLPAVEGYRSLRTNIQFLKMEKGTKTILVTSASPEEGKSTVLVNLAAALSEMGKKVIIIEADLRRPVLRKYLSCAELNGSAGPGTEKGLTAVLAGSASLEDSLCDTPYPGLRVLFSGIKPPNPSELVSSHRMENLLKEVGDIADYVLVDAPPILAISDAVAISPMVDGVLLVASYGMAERDTSRHCVNLLHKVKAEILGLVINNVTPMERYGYYHYYYYRQDEEVYAGDKASRFLHNLKKGRRNGKNGGSG